MEKTGTAAESEKPPSMANVFRIRHMAYSVHNALGPGLLEHAYKEAMCVELKHTGIPFEREQVFSLEYRGENVGTYFADIVVDNKIILELKSVDVFHETMEAQLINYLKIAKIPVGYLINFRNKKVYWRRCVNQRE
jgi:GxxExxY protein